MPQAVMDAFKSGSILSSCRFSFLISLLLVADLIRHGKNHHQAQGASAPKQQQQQQASIQSTTIPQPAAGAQQQQQQQQQHHQQQQRTQAHGHAHTPTKEVAEKIVQEEREAKNKMPVYKGLERYKLLDKMGE